MDGAGPRRWPDHGPRSRANGSDRARPRRVSHPELGIGLNEVGDETATPGWAAFDPPTIACVATIETREMSHRWRGFTIRRPWGTLAQAVRGRVLEAGTKRPVALAGFLLLGRDSVPLSSALADSLGHFSVPIPEGGEYYLATERIGYRSTLSPLLELSGSPTYEVDVEMAPEPVGLEGLAVRVRPEAMERWLTLRGHVGNPNRLIGYRALYGARVEEARAGARVAYATGWATKSIARRSGRRCTVTGGRTLYDASNTPLTSWRSCQKARVHPALRRSAAGW